MSKQRKPSNCECGNYRDAGSRWVVIDRRPPPKSSRVKCLVCNWRWYNFRQYVKHLPDHREHSRVGMTDENIIERIIAGTLVVDIKTAAVKSFNISRKLWRPLRVKVRTSNGSTYNFVEVCHQGKKKTVALHRLVWMFDTREIVPAGFDVDHVNGKRGEFPDALDNLRLLESSINRGLGCPSESGELFDESNDPF